jgi:hypothetical protein
MKTVWKFILDVVPPSFNVYDRMHWGEKKRLREQFGRLVMFGLFEQGWRMPADAKDVPRMSVRILICRPRRFDRENLWASVKPVLDGMRDIKALRNDSEVWLDLDVKQEVSRIPRMEISISECEPEARTNRAQFKLEGV